MFPSCEGAERSSRRGQWGSPGPGRAPPPGKTPLLPHPHRSRPPAWVEPLALARQAPIVFSIAKPLPGPEAGRRDWGKEEGKRRCKPVWGRAGARTRPGGGRGEQGRARGGSGETKEGWRVPKENGKPGRGRCRGVPRGTCPPRHTPAQTDRQTHTYRAAAGGASACTPASAP